LRIFTQIILKMMVLYKGSYTWDSYRRGSYTRGCYTHQNTVAEHNFSHEAITVFSSA